MPRWIDSVVNGLKWVAQPRNLILSFLTLSYLQKTQREDPSSDSAIKRNDPAYKKIEDELRKLYPNRPDLKIDEVVQIDNVLDTRISPATLNNLLNYKEEYQPLNKMQVSQKIWQKTTDTIFDNFRAGYYLRIPSETRSLVIQNTERDGKSVTSIEPLSKFATIPNGAKVVSFPENAFIKCKGTDYCTIYVAEKSEGAVQFVLKQTLTSNEVDVKGLITVLAVRNFTNFEFPDQLMFVNENGQTKTYEIFPTLKKAIFKEGESLNKFKDAAPSKEVGKIISKVHEFLQKNANTWWLPAQTDNPFIKFFNNLVKAKTPDELRKSYEHLVKEKHFAFVPGLEKQINEFIRAINEEAAHLEARPRIHKVSTPRSR